jgi:DNA polymerase delta subunit 2
MLIVDQHWIAAPPPREKYISPDGQDQVMLEDESGRLRLTGSMLNTEMLMTGCIVAVMGTENANGDFEVIDMKVPDLPRQPQRWERDEISGKTGVGRNIKTPRTEGSKVAIVSGLGIGGDVAEGLTLDIFSEWLLGEASGEDDQSEAGTISRLIIAGNSLAESGAALLRDEDKNKNVSKKYGYDAGAYNAAPTEQLDTFLSSLLPSIPITLIPGSLDPANVSLPQQSIHRAMFPKARLYTTNPEGKEAKEANWFDSVTNPWEGDLDGWRFLGTGGQTIDDIFRYVSGEDRLEMMERTLRMRCVAPTAPDTLCELKSICKINCLSIDRRFVAPV